MLRFLWEGLKVLASEEGGPYVDRMKRRYHDHTPGVYHKPDSSWPRSMVKRWVHAYGRHPHWVGDRDIQKLWKRYGCDT